MTPALLASNRLNAKKSTGPRTARGKARSRLNRMRHGMRSPEYISFVTALLNAPPCRVGATAHVLLSSMQVHHPVFEEIAQTIVQAEVNVCNKVPSEHWVMK